MFKEKRCAVFEKERQQLIIHDVHEGLGDHLKTKALAPYREVESQHAEKCMTVEPYIRTGGRCQKQGKISKKSLICKVYQLRMKLYNKLGSTFLIFQKWMDLTNWLFAMVISLNGLKQKLSLVSQYELSQYFVQRNLVPCVYENLR